MGTVVRRNVVMITIKKERSPSARHCSLLVFPGHSCRITYLIAPKMSSLAQLILVLDLLKNTGAIVERRGIPPQVIYLYVPPAFVVLFFFAALVKNIHHFSVPWTFAECHKLSIEIKRSKTSNGIGINGENQAESHGKP